MKEDVKKEKLKAKQLVLYFVFVLMLIYLVYAVYLLVKQPTDKVTVEKGVVNLEETDIGYIIRDEIVVKGDNYKNGMEQIKAEGEKTAKGDSIYRYYSKNEDNIKKQIEELDLQIQEVLQGDKSIFSSDVKLLENQIDEKVQELYKISDLSVISEYKKQIEDIIIKKAKVAGETSASGSKLKQLYNQRVQLEKQLNSGAEYIKAPESGIVSYKVDGLEETFSPNNFSTLTKGFLEDLNVKTGQLVATNSECGKIIKDSKIYIVTVSKSEAGRKAEVDDAVQVRLSNSKVIDAKIVYVSKEDDENTILVLEMDKQVEELTNFRKISFELVWWKNTGLKVPNQAIVEEDGLQYVVRNRAGYLTKILVKVKQKNDKYSIVSNYTTKELEEKGFNIDQISQMKSIMIYDQVVLNPDLSKTM